MKHPVGVYAKPVQNIIGGGYKKHHSVTMFVRIAQARDDNLFGPAPDVTPLPPVRAPPVENSRMSVGVVEIQTGRLSLFVPSLLIGVFSLALVTSRPDGLNGFGGVAATGNRGPLSIPKSREATTMC